MAVLQAVAMVRMVSRWSNEEEEVLTMVAPQAAVMVRMVTQKGCTSSHATASLWKARIFKYFEMGLRGFDSELLAIKEVIFH